MEMYRFPVYFGWDLFGKVDRVPGRCHVATEFFHVWFLPVAPRRSFLVLEDPGRGQGVSVVPIAPSYKSLLWTWGRLFLWPLGLLGVCLTGLSGVLLAVAVVAGVRLDVQVLAPLAAPPAWTALCAAALWAIYRFNRAGPARAEELTALARAGGTPYNLVRGRQTRRAGTRVP